MMKRILPLLLALCVLAQPVSAACVNRFVTRAEGPQRIVTLLTGELTYQEAQDLAKAIASKQSGLIEWVDDAGKPVAKQYGPLKVVRPMPVGCNGRTSGVVMIVSFLTSTQPKKTLKVKIKDQIVTFEQQAE